MRAVILTENKKEIIKNVNSIQFIFDISKEQDSPKMEGVVLNGVNNQMVGYLKFDAIKGVWLE